MDRLVSTDLNPIQHLWGELECQLRAKSNSVADLINALVNGSKSLQHRFKIWWKAFTEEWRLLKLHITTYDF